MSKRLFDHDADTGVTTWFEYDHSNDSFSLTYQQEVEPVLSANRASQADGFDKRADWWHAARIPPGIQYEWLVKHGVNMWDKNHKAGVKRLLNDPEYRWLRVKNFII